MDIVQSGKRLRELRKKYRYSQQALADISHVSRPWISKFEAGTIPSPGVVMFRLLAAAFEMSERDFFTVLGLDYPVEEKEGLVNPGVSPENEQSVTSSDKYAEENQAAIDRAASLILYSEELRPYLPLVADLLEGLGELAIHEAVQFERILLNMIETIRLHNAQRGSGPPHQRFLRS